MPVLNTASPPTVPDAPTLRPRSTAPAAKAMRAGLAGALDMSGAPDDRVGKKAWGRYEAPPGRQAGVGRDPAGPGVRCPMSDVGHRTSDGGPRPGPGLPPLIPLLPPPPPLATISASHARLPPMAEPPAADRRAVAGAVGHHLGRGPAGGQQHRQQRGA